MRGGARNNAVRHGATIVFGSALGVGLTVLLSGALGGGSSDPATLLTVETKPTPAADSRPASLRVSAYTPATAIAAGRPVSVTVHWSDGEGAYAGDAAFFGEPEGLGALAITRCQPGHRPAGAHAGSNHYTHTFARPGTYRATFEIDTQSCTGGVEHRTATLTFVVTPVG